MSYAVNIEEPGNYYHICFKTANDRFALTQEKDIHSLAAFMQHYKKKHKIKIHAFAIMSNHLHLLLRNSFDEENAIKWFIRDIKREFAKYHNRRYGAKGSLWQRSYRQKCIQGDIQLINTLVYILNNPVQAHLSDFAWEYSWSSSHQLFNKTELKNLNKEGKFFNRKELNKIYHRAKKQKYGEGLPEKELVKRGLGDNVDHKKHKVELIQGKRRFKTQGKWQYYFPRSTKSKVYNSSRLFSLTITDKLPQAIEPGQQLLRTLCRTRADGSRSNLNPFKTHDNHIVFESDIKSKVEIFQNTYAHRLPIRALGRDAIIQTDKGWALVIKHGRRRVS